MTANSASTCAAHNDDAPVAMELRDVNSSYGRTAVLRDVTIRVAAGSVTALIGPNGAGKTTTLRAASGLLKPTSGHILLDSKDVTDSSPHNRARMGLCHVPEGKGVYRTLTVRENLLMQIPDRSVSEGIERAVAAFPILGKRLGQQAGTLSGGEQQMLALCAAYLRRPRVVLVDEPSLGLAPIVVDAVFEFLHALRTEGIALLLVDQYATRTLALADYAYVMRRGQIGYAGEASALLRGDVF
ncbi:ABC transporter ATP-binding protein, partial [Streptomyces sp. NPDC090088]|uniref:ABC transporter ATP-binding protein n=1 Tax=Streptomyces sp. NPDC090088 TaxID=3365944 RepID=UPI0038074F72